MRILFVSGAGILPEQRVGRWKMVSKLYSQMGEALRILGHKTYYYVHPEAADESLPAMRTWLCPDHEHFPYVLENFAPDFVFCWNGGSSGDVITATLAASANAKMIFSEQGWFPQSKTIYFDMTGTNARCSTRYRSYSILGEKQRLKFLTMRRTYIDGMSIGDLFDADVFSIAPPDFAKPIFVPLQDERDLNIIQDAPFATMNEFVAYLSGLFPDSQLRVRPHPKYPKPHLSVFSNVTVESPKVSMFKSLSECGLVVGINSTTLLESALLGKSVISLGESLATGSGLLYDHRPPSSVIRENIAIDTSIAESVLFTLFSKQLARDSLSSPMDVVRSSVFSEMREFASAKSLQAWL